MGLSWSDLRPLNGSRSDGFEELCSQLARSESPDGAEFFRKGNPDGGVECFCRLEDGREWGWQAKFFPNALSEAQLRQLDESVKTALEAHPELVRYFVCVPRDRSDSRRPEITTEMQRWETRVAKWEGWASDLGMVVEFVWWGSSELISRLSRESNGGRSLFWFGTPGNFSSEWFASQLKRSIKVAGPRYSPEIHVDVPIVEDFELFGRTESAETLVRDAAMKVRRAPSFWLRRLIGEEILEAPSELGGVLGLVDKVVDALYALRCLPNENWRLTDILEDISDALRLIRDCQAPLADAADAYRSGEEAEDASRRNKPNPYREATQEIYALERVIWDASNTLWRIEEFTSADLMILMGEAGSGKTHLLCDIAGKRLTDQCPSVVLMGQQFTTTDLPWVQARNQLDLENLTAEQFVGALEAAAQVADSRVLFMIDAINEGEGYTIWPAHLVDLLNRLRASPWVGVVLSVRTPYMEYVLPEGVRETACEVVHEGFADDTYAALERFCEHYELDFPATPLLRPEFDNPLFLKTLCEGLQHSQTRRIPVGALGIDRVFNMYVEAVDTDLARKLNYDPQGEVVARALDAVAMEMVEANSRWLPRQRVQALVDPLAQASGFRSSLYRALVDTGLLTELPKLSRDDDWTVHFGFEWFADHRIANCLINRYGDLEELVSALVRGDTHNRTVEWTPWDIPLDALSVLLPERLGVELPEVLADRGEGRRVKHAFLRGLPWRDLASIGPSCLGMVEELLATARQSDTVEVFDALVTCAMVPGHPLGSEFIDDWLRQLNMPDRDAVWSKYLFLAYGEGGAVDRLLDWGEKQSRHSAALDHKTAAACSTVLAWFLTSSHRFVRDRATKCLVALLTDRVELTCEVVRQFDEVDDLYLRERVMAAAFGVSMRSNEGQALAPLADLVYRLFFVHGEPPVHILLRDYARGVIERAQHLGAEVAADANLVDPPYRSEWPRIPNADEVERFNPWREGHHSEPTDAELARSEIYRSVMTWDFARYVIGTNFTSESNRWLSLENVEPLWQSDRELADNFKDSLPLDLQSAFEELWTNTRSVQRGISFVTDESEEESRDTDESEFTFTGYERYIDPRQEEAFVAQLSDELESAYRDLVAARGSRPPRLSLDIIQHYVLWRVFDLGWTAERFGALDRDIYGRSIRSSGFRASSKPERTGKKYQWIAYHEILGYISDKYQYRVMHEDEEPNNAYRGTWQLSVRDIDPSVVDTEVPPETGSNEDSNGWWGHEVEITPLDDVGHEQWLSCDSDVPSPEQYLRFTDPKDGSTWIKIHGPETWKTPTPPGFDQYEVDRREVWLYARGYLIDAAEVEEFMTWAKEVKFSANWLPEPPRFHSLFFGEFGWSFASSAQIGEYIKTQHPAPWKGQRCPVGLRPVALEYHSDVGDYDCSVAKGYSYYRPAEDLVEAMSLRWSGKGAGFVDPDGTLVAFDPSAHEDCSSALLVREERLHRFLDETDSALVWAISGEKSAIVPRENRDQWAGSLNLSGACVYEPAQLKGFLATYPDTADSEDVDAEGT